MPKNPAELLRRELEKLNVELLDIYTFRDLDVIRAYSKQTGKVIVYKSKRKITTLASQEDVKNLAVEIAKST